MLEHRNAAPVKPSRVVVIGAAGFVGNACASRLEREDVPVVRLTRQDVDLTAPDAIERLSSRLRTGDAVVAVSARAPCKNADMLVENMTIARALAGAFASAELSHAVNISSDAVYKDTSERITESHCASPDSLHGAMHLAREVLLKTSTSAPLAVLRPSLLYGANDPHNGYGPNRFLRQALRGEDIVLFGEGEERRDHVYIDDVAEIVARVLYHRSTGILNIATGTVCSFRDIASTISQRMAQAVRIRGTPRSGPMPHNGYRAFDAAACERAFPDFQYTPLHEGLARAHRQLAGHA
jgi:nucleoside-diphosphate-sugar epimerase